MGINKREKQIIEHYIQGKDVSYEDAERLFHYVKNVVEAAWEVIKSMLDDIGDVVDRIQEQEKEYKRDLFAMQNMAVIGGGSVRGPDAKVDCNLCNGTGRL